MNSEMMVGGRWARSRSAIEKSALVLAGTAVIALAAQVTVPMLPVPMTLQTLAISIIGLTYGARLAALTLLVYLFEGALGLPVFANAGAGIAKLAGPTAGYLWGFVAMAWLTGWFVEHGFSRGVLRVFLAASIPAALLYVPGVFWLAAMSPLDMGDAATVGALPFLAGDAVKSGLAALIVIGGWRAVRRRSI